MGIIRRLVMGTEDLKEVFKLDIVYGKNHETLGGGNVTVSVYAWYIEGNSIKSTLIDGSYVDGGSISISFNNEPEYEVEKPYFLNGVLYGDPEQVAAITTTHYATDIDYERVRY